MVKIRRKHMTNELNEKLTLIEQEISNHRQKLVELSLRFAQLTIDIRKLENDSTMLEKMIESERTIISTLEFAKSQISQLATQEKG
jgi:chromosome segregation ATPase